MLVEILAAIILFIFLAFFAFVTHHAHKTVHKVAAKISDTPKDAPVTRRSMIAAALAALQLSPDDVLLDLGSGDGRIIHAATKETGCTAVGHETHPIEYWKSRARLLFSKRARVESTSLFDADLKAATRVYCHLDPDVMAKLEPFLAEGLAPGAVLVSYDHPLPNTPFAHEFDIGVEHDTRGKKLYIYNY